MQKCALPHFCRLSFGVLNNKNDVRHVPARVRPSERSVLNFYTIDIETAQLPWEGESMRTSIEKYANLKMMKFRGYQDLRMKTITFVASSGKIRVV